MRLILLLLLLGSLHAEIIQIKKIDECSQYIQPDMLIIFDIDNTLIEPTQTLGSDQWFSYRISEYRERGYSEQEAGMITLAEWVSIQNMTKVQLVEPSTQAFIQKLQKNQWKVMALTSRGLELATKTMNQLTSVGVDLGLTAPLRREVSFHQSSSVLFRNGILFTSGKNKGALLFEFFQQSGYVPKKILCIDDKAAHLQAVEQACAEHQVPFLGLRYGFLDDKVKNFRAEIAKQEMDRFGKLISDEEALVQLR